LGRRREGGLSPDRRRVRKPFVNLAEYYVTLCPPLWPIVKVSLPSACVLVATIVHIILCLDSKLRPHLSNIVLNDSFQTNVVHLCTLLFGKYI
jgi:hypothetical protein